MDHIIVILMGAAGRDFHNFNTYYRDNDKYKVLAFTATQIPNIEGRKYPAELAGKLYPNGIDIYPEDEIVALIKKHEVDEVVWGKRIVVNNRPISTEHERQISDNMAYFCSGKVLCMGLGIGMCQEDLILDEDTTEILSIEIDDEIKFNIWESQKGDLSEIQKKVKLPSELTIESDSYSPYQVELLLIKANRFIRKKQQSLFPELNIDFEDIPSKDNQAAELFVNQRVNLPLYFGFEKIILVSSSSSSASKR